MQREPHLRDEELVSYLDAELGAPRMESARAHLSHCWLCRARLGEFERGVTGFMAWHRLAHPGEGAAPAAGPTARLKAALSAAPAAVSGPLARRSPALSWALAASVLAPVAVVLLWLNGPRMDAAGPLPDARLTPGAIRFVSRQQVCALPSEDEGRLVPPELARRVFAQYRIADPQPRAYEVDYLIGPALGGTTAMENLWPVPYARGEWTSRVKDALEDRLRTMVCAGELDLATAQRELAGNWIAAYRKYFGSPQPIAAHAHFVKDSPWE